MTARSRRRAGDPVNYFISFSDLLVGLLFIFITMLMTYALATKLAQAQLQQTQLDLQGRLNGLERRIELRRALLGHIVEELRREQVTGATADMDEGVLRFSSDLLFERGSASLSWRATRIVLPAVRRVLERELPCYGGASQNVRTDCPPGTRILEAVYIEGHTDRITFRYGGRFDDNWDLSSQRARATYAVLVEGGPMTELQSASGRSRLVGLSAYADTRPISDDDNRNRRIDIRFLLAAPTEADIAAGRR